MNAPLPIDSPAGERALAELVDRKTLYAFDYDGTLAPFADRPDQAFMAPETAEAFRGLVAARPVAVISGRSLATLSSLLPVTPRFVVGNHGVEGPGWGPDALEEGETLVRRWLPLLERALASRPDIRLENKRYSMTAHFRGSPDGEGARLGVLRAIEALDPRPRALGGVDVVNLVPPDAPHKGSALAKLMRDNGFERALYVGDDITDEDVFLHAGPEVLTLRVACRPAPTAARFTTTLPAMVDLLRRLSR